jgi:hypothetical protein
MFLNHLYGGMDEPDPKIIDVFVCKLRKKLAGYGEHHIETVWGRGGLRTARAAVLAPGRRGLSWKADVRFWTLQPHPLTTQSGPLPREDEA